MKLYFAGYSTDKEIFQVEEAKYLLESYLLFKNKDYRGWHKEKKLLDRQLFLDSGAFSAFSRGVEIDIEHYCNFIKQYQDIISVYAGLDVIGDFESTMKNIKYMEERGLNPLPTFHYGSDLEELKKIVKKYDYIALGGLVPLAMHQPKLRNWLDKCFAIIKTNCKVHGFGVNAFWAWNRYPFYSVDATSWLMGGKFRRAVKFTGNNLIAYNKDSKESIKTMECHKDHYTEINRNNVLEYLKAANYITNLWEKRGIIWKD